VVPQTHVRGRGDEAQSGSSRTVNRKKALFRATVLFFVVGGRWNCEKRWLSSGLLQKGSGSDWINYFIHFNVNYVTLMEDTEIWVKNGQFFQLILFF
jgi:hypothetical protein